MSCLSRLTIAAVNRAANDTGNASEQVLDVSRELTAKAQNLKSVVEKFLTEVRAA